MTVQMKRAYLSKKIDFKISIFSTKIKGPVDPKNRYLEVDFFGQVRPFNLDGHICGKYTEICGKYEEICGIYAEMWEI